MLKSNRKGLFSPLRYLKVFEVLFIRLPPQNIGWGVKKSRGNET